MVDFITPAVIDIRANDAVASNTVGGNGQMLFNTTSNSLYVYDGVTVGGYKTELTAYVTYSFQGSSYGYNTGGANPVNTPYNQDDRIEKYSFVSDGNSVDVGELVTLRSAHASASSSSTGFATQGYDNAADTTTLDSFPFASDTSATEVADYAWTFANQPATKAILGARSGSHNAEKGYIVGGYNAAVANLHDISYYDYASYTLAENAADLFQKTFNGTGNSSPTSGYRSGGLFTPANQRDLIQKFSFASLANATDVGEMSQNKQRCGSASSTDYGFLAGGQPNTSTIQKFSFASDASGVDTGGTLSSSKSQISGASQTDYGYMTGGGSQNQIEKFPYSISAGTTTDVGDLIAVCNDGGSNQI